MEKKKYKIAYFGGEPLGVPVLEELKSVGIVPELIVCNPDRPAGRKHIITPPPVKSWAEAHGVDYFQPETIPKTPADFGRLTSEPWDLFVVVAYNHILPTWFLELPTYKTINLHPSLLPLLRGASPIRSTILNDMREQCGVSVMLLDEKMDHGPLLAQEKLQISPEVWPMAGPMLDEALARLGGAVLADTISLWMNNQITPTEQSHELATYCGKITKEHAELELNPYQLPSGQEAYELYLKIQAYAGWPVAFFIHNQKRFKITKASLSQDGSLIIETIIPEGRKEMAFHDYF